MRVVAVLMLAFPLGASADLILLEYDGFVDSVTREACGCDPTRDYARDHPEFTAYSVGDRVHGFLTIDTSKAPPDSAHEPEVGIYRSPRNSGGFISGNGAPLFDPVINRRGSDHVSVVDAAQDLPFEIYSVRDHWRSPNGHGQMLVSLGSNLAGLDLVSGPGMAQTIDATRSSDLGMSGFIIKVVKGVKGWVSVHARLVFDRVRVTPGRCKA